MICRWFKKKKKKQLRYVPKDNSKQWHKLELDILSEINHYRLKKKMGILTADVNLYHYAENRALECKMIGRLDNHEGFPRIRKKLEAIGLSSLGENLGYGYPNAQKLVRAWYNSPSHKRLMLSRHRTYAGVGFSNEGNKTYFCLILAR